MDLLRLSQMALWVIATVCGSLGILCVCASKEGALKFVGGSHRTTGTTFSPISPPYALGQQFQ